MIKDNGIGLSHLSIEDFINDLENKKIKLWLDKDSLRYKAQKGAMTDEMLGCIKDRKEDIIQYIRIKDAKSLLYESISKVEDKDFYPLSASQKRMYLLQQLDKESTAYNITNALRIEGNFDREKLAQVFRHISYRHEALRTSFETIDGSPVQKIHSSVEIGIDYQEILGQEEQIDSLIKEFVTPFDLACAPLMRLKLIKFSERSYLLLFDIHHIISDGVSAAILVKEFNQLYAGKKLDDLSIQYKDYVAWQEKLLSSELITKQRDFWLDQLAGEIPVINLPADYQRPQKFSFMGESIKLKVDLNLSKKLNSLARECKVTLYTVLLSAYYALLSKYTGQSDIIVGTPTAGRTHEDVYSIIGMFVNTIALKNYIDHEKSFKEFMAQVSENTLKAFDNQEYPFGMLVEGLGVQRDFSRNPIFDVMFAFQNTGPSNIDANDLKVIRYENKHKMAQFDITLNCEENKDGIDIEINYCSSIYKAQSMEQFVRRYINLLKSATDNPLTKLGNMEILTNAEKEHILKSFAGNKTNYPMDKTLHELFEEQAKRTPDNIAVVFENEKLTYKELNEKANSLARVLKEKGVKAEIVAAIMLEPCLEMAVGILAILKAGGAYLPINPDLPQERIKYMLNDCMAQILLVGKNTISDNIYGIEAVDLECADLYKHDTSDLNEAAGPKNLAYIIYTSGTTGNPKGVLIEHKSVSVTVKWRADEYKFCSGDTVLQLFSYSFDGFVTSFFTPIISGATVVLINNGDLMNPNELKRILLLYKIMHFICVPTLYSTIIEYMSPDDMKYLKVITLAGEKTPKGLIRESKKKKADLELANEYGPTENTVVTTIQRDMNEENNSVIGSPIVDTQLYVMDSNGNIMPPGVPGELCVSGRRLARGYLNRDELTTEKFIANPFEPDKRLYKTGDLVRMLPDGTIEILGRIDNQVKVRGYRIELSEIEERLMKFENIKEAVVTVFESEDGEKSICAYYTKKKDIDIAKIKEFLSLELPSYMAPSYFIPLESIPITKNGKVDRNSLPKPTEAFSIGVEYVEPQSKIEKVIADLWKQVLGIAEIGTNHNFFDIGGDSMRLTRLFLKLEDIYPGLLTVSDLFSYATISKLALYINKKLEANCATNKKRDLGIAGSNEAVNISGAKEKAAWNIQGENDIAVIGMAVKMPLANNKDEFWDIVRSKVDCIGELPQNRQKDIEDMINKENTCDKKVKYSKMAYLDEIDKFDCGFFGISPREADLMDPNQRLFLETTWKAIEDAGYGGRKLSGSRTGVYLGFSGDSEYGRYLWENNPEDYSIFLAGNLTPIIASRISYYLDLKGPSILLNTACSSSLIALHYACQGITTGECDLAIAGGVSIKLLPVENESKLGIESGDSKTKAFDNSSDGAGRGEGVASVLLKPLKKALLDGDSIYAVIKGSAVNQDGTSNGITAPSPVAQADVIETAWKKAKIDPETITYIETHGTGTKLGDPIEIDGIKKAFENFTSKKQFCAISALKTNIGHLDSAAGVAGFIKAALALKNREIPPMLHFKEPNSAIDFINSPVYVNESVTGWYTGDYPRRCGVSSFGLSGTNCHMVLEEAPEISQEPHGECSCLNILALSAKTHESLRELVNSYRDYFRKADKLNIRNICYTANTGRGHYGFRAAFIIESGDCVADKLDRLDIDNTEDSSNDGLFYTGQSICAETREINSEINKSARLKINEFMENGSKDRGLLYEICDLYVRGAQIDWESLYKGENVRKVNLPTYPFMRKRCWVNTDYKINRKDALEKNNLYYVVDWEKRSLNINTYTACDKNMLIFMDYERKFDELAYNLKGYSSSVIKVYKGEEFKKIDDYNYTINGKQDNYEMLFSNLNNAKIDTIVLLTSLSGSREIKNMADLQKSHEMGVFSLLHLTKSILNNINNDVELVIVSDYVNEVTGKESIIKPENGILFGLGKTIGVEYSNIRCRLIDIDDLSGNDKLLEEIVYGSNCYQAAYRDGARYVDVLNNKVSSEFKSDEMSIKSDGVYIITGGTGRLGLEAGKYLASLAKVNLALVNRSNFPEREKWKALIKEDKYEDIHNKLKSIMYMEEAGARVECYSGDITDETQLDQLLSHLRNKYGKINGIIHCAAVGVGNDGIMTGDITVEAFKEMLLPKVEGTWLIDKLTERDCLDFFIMYSSAITSTGGKGSGSYIAANSFMDSYAVKRRKAGRKTLAINWPVIENENLKDIIDTKKLMFNILSLDKAMSSLGEIMNKNVARLIIGELNIESDIILMEEYLPFRFSEELRASIKKISSRKGTVDGNKPRCEEPRNETEKIVIKTMMEVLGLDDMGINDDFFESGGHSLLASQLASRLSKSLGKSIPIQYIFDNSTAAKLAGFLSETFMDLLHCDEDYMEIEL
ncbi:MAG: amino acid adenylation domain-containing protein [Bacillota bacterium]|nr:amino acid adenylation domain-containing protein [Bacillota bacterium]